MARDKITILHIDDDPDVRELIKDIVTSAGMQHHEAADGISGISLAQEIKPDLIIIDIDLPDLFGTELATKFRKNNDLQDSVIVALSGMTDPGSRELALVAGCDGFLAKDLGPKELLDHIEDYLRGRRDEIDEDRRETYRQLYLETMVDHLTDKVDQLQSSNLKRTEQTRRLAAYSQKLEGLMLSIYRLHLCQSSDALTGMLVEELDRLFGFSNIAYLTLDDDGSALQPDPELGRNHHQYKGLSWTFDSATMAALFAENQVCYFSSLDKLNNKQRALFRKFGPHRFAVAAFEPPHQPHSKTLMLQNLQFLAANARSEVAEANGDSQPEVRSLSYQDDTADRGLRIGGYFYMNYEGKDTPVLAYDLKILEMLFSTATLLYQNLMLREQLQHLFVKAERDAITDGLTGLFNVRYFKEQFALELSRARRHKSEFAVILLDIDYFKVYNDTLGHPAGDKVLKQVAALMQENTRETDLVARYGGEEFVILCPEINKDGGKIIAEKLNHIIATTPFPKEKELPHKKVTISVGVAAFPADADSTEDLVDAADQALYRAKAEGRNRVCLYKD